MIGDVTHDVSLIGYSNTKSYLITYVTFFSIYIYSNFAVLRIDPAEGRARPS